MKKLVFLYSLPWLAGIYILLKLFLVAGGVVHGSLPVAFAVDSDENIYIGYEGPWTRGECIEVFHDGELLRTIKPPTHREYVIYIDNDELIIGRKISGKVSIYDLQGNYLEDSELSYKALKSTVSNTIEQNGKTFSFHVSYGFKPFEVRCDGVVIYKMSTADYIFNGLPAQLLSAIFVVVVLFTMLLAMMDEEIQEYAKRTGMRHL